MVPAKEAHPHTSTTGLRWGSIRFLRKREGGKFCCRKLRRARWRGAATGTCLVGIQYLVRYGSEETSEGGGGGTGAASRSALCPCATVHCLATALVLSFSLPIIRQLSRYLLLRPLAGHGHSIIEVSKTTPADPKTLMLVVSAYVQLSAIE